MKKMNLRLLCLLSLLMAVSASCIGRNSSSNNNNNTKTDDMKPLYLTTAEFREKVANFDTDPDKWKYLGDKPAIIDFYADWCGPCKMIAPVLEELAAEYGGKLYIYKVDIEKEQELAAAFGIRSIPALLFIPLEGDPQMAMGAMPKSSFEEAIKEVLGVNK